jgi:hypothetical protein
LWVFFPDTRKLALEEIAALFGDEDEIAVYQRDIVVAPGTNTIIENDKAGGEEPIVSYQEVVDGQQIKGV